MENRICPIPKKDKHISISASYEPVSVRALGKFTYLFFTRIPKDSYNFYSYFKDEAAQVSNVPTAGFNPRHLDPEPLATMLNNLTNLVQAAENSAVGSHTFRGKIQTDNISKALHNPIPVKASAPSSSPLPILTPPSWSASNHTELLHLPNPPTPSPQ